MLENENVNVNENENVNVNVNADENVRSDDRNEKENNEIRETEIVNDNEPASVDNGERRSSSFGIAYIPEGGNENGTKGEGYTYVPYGSEPLSSVTAPVAAKPKKAKKKKGNGLAAVLSVVVVCCVLFSAAAGFGGTYFAGKLLRGDSGSEQPTSSNGGVVEIFQSSRTVETLNVSGGKLMTVSETAALVKDSVVEITTESVESSSYLGQYVISGAGSGVIISSDGYIITNNHVIEDATKITVRLTDKSEYEATLIGTDDVADIAVIKIKPSDDVRLSVAVMGNSDNIVVGESVIAIGNPLGSLGGTVTDGIVSALDREVSIEGTTMNLLQTNAAINPGNSGGGLFNLYGELIGVVNAKYSSTGIEGLGFVIPINDAKAVAEQLMEYGYVRGRPHIGITTLEVDIYGAMRYFRSNQAGVYVYEAAANTGLQKGDRIITIDGNEVTESADITNYINTLSVGDTVTIVVMRSGRTAEVSVTLTEKVPETAVNANKNAN